MRIGIYDPYLDTLSGGEKYMLTAALCLSARHEVDIFWDNRPELMTALNKLNINLEGINIVPNIFSAKTPFFKRLIKSRAYDRLLILSDGSIPITLAGKTILHFQFPVEWVRGNSLRTKIKLSKTNKIICNSFFTKYFIDRKFKTKSLVLYPPCIDLSLLDKKNRKDAPINKKNVILTVGRYHSLGRGDSIKKFEFMLETFKLMVDNGLKGWEFYAVTSTLKDYSKNISHLEESAVSYPIHIVNNIPYYSLIKLYRESKIYWHAAGFGEDLEKNPERAEHFGITTVEAMAHGAVPVVFNGGGQKEIVLDKINGFVWESRAEFMQNTKRLMIDGRLRSEMASIGQKSIQLFTTDNFCRSINNMIE